MKRLQPIFLQVLLIAALGFLPCRAQTRITELSVEDAPAIPKSGRIESGLVVPHFAAGVIFSTDFHFFSLEDYPIVIDAMILGDNGQPMGVDLRSPAGNLFNAIAFTVELEPRGEVRIEAMLEQAMNAAGSRLRSGALLLVPRNFAADIGVTAVITYHDDEGDALYRTSVPGLADSQKQIRMPFTNTGGFMAGVGLMSFPLQDATFIARDPLGVELCRTTMRFNTPRHMADFLVNLLPCTAGRNGVLDIMTAAVFAGEAEGLSAVGLSFDPDIRMWTQVPYRVREGYIRARADTSKCIQKQFEHFDNGNPIHLWDCNATGPGAVGNRTWFFEPDTGYISNGVNPAQCIHKVNDNFDDGNRMHLFECDIAGDDAVRNKTWIYEPRTGYIRNATRPDKCIQRKDNNFNNGNPLELEDCDQGDAADRARRTWLFE